MPLTYLGWTVIAMPADPPAPASIEFQQDFIVGILENPFKATQQIQDWQSNYMQASVSYAWMPKPQAQPWVDFLFAAKGPLCVFQFPDSICAKFPKELTSDGSTPRYWRLKDQKAKWQVKLGPLYALTMEIREAI